MLLRDLRIDRHQAQHVPTGATTSGLTKPSTVGPAAEKDAR